MYLVHAIGLAGPALPPSPDCIGELLENRNGIFPVDASIGDGDTLLESRKATSLGHLLVALVQVRLNHDSDNAVLALADLVTNDLGDLGLILVVLLRVAF